MEVRGNQTSFPGFQLRLFKSRFDNIILDAEENAGNERAIIFKTADKERLRADSYGNIGINKSNPTTKLDLNGNFQMYPSGNAGTNGALKLRIVPSLGSTIIEANSDYVWANHDIIINAAHSGGGNINQLVLYRTGDVGIGTASPDARLAVKGNIHAQEVRVDLTGSTAPDYVFERDYKLISLDELEKYVQMNSHLPEIPSSDQMELNGINLKEMNLLLLKKVEELTLHLIEQSKRIDNLESENKRLKDLLTKK